MLKMKQKTIAIIYIILLSLTTVIHLYIPKTEAAANDVTIIPHEAIRLRILANSDTNKDQQIKQKIRDEVNAEITKWVVDLTSLDEARQLLQSRLPDIQLIAEQVVANEGVKQQVQVKFDRVQFPTKLYGQFLYPAGEYEAIVITLGKGTGANWWCVLFPPLCFLDFSNGVAVSDGFDEEANKPSKSKVSKTKNDDSEQADKVDSQPVYVDNDEAPVKVTFFIKELWNKLFKS